MHIIWWSKWNIFNKWEENWQYRRLCGGAGSYEAERGIDGAPLCPPLGSNEQCIFRRLNWNPSGLNHFHDFFLRTSQSLSQSVPQALPANMGGPCRVQSCFAEMLCDFCSYELKNRYENSGGMNTIKDQHAGFVITSLEKENIKTLFFCTI